MEEDVFVWSRRKFDMDQVVQEGVGWAIINGGYFQLVAKDGMVYEFPPSAIESLYFLPPSLTYQGSICVKINSNYSNFAKEKYGTDLINIDGYNGWHKLKKFQGTVADLMRLAYIMDDNGISINGDFDKFGKLLK